MGSPNTMISHCVGRNQRRANDVLNGSRLRGGADTDISTKDDTSTKDNTKHTLEVNFASVKPQKRKTLNESVVHLQTQLSLYTEGSNEHTRIFHKLRAILIEQKEHLKEIIVID